VVNITKTLIGLDCTYSMMDSSLHTLRWQDSIHALDLFAGSWQAVEFILPF
jgi:hypothetical protein